MAQQTNPPPASSSSVIATLTQSMDWPEMMLNPKATLNSPLDSEKAQELSKYWTQKEGLEDVLFHLSLVSAGMASRPRRPDRETIFRPFSSRDAHILLQLKRTKEVATGSLVNTVLEYALRAGKASRNPEKVPSLLELKSYGTGDSKYSSEAPKELTLRIQKVSSMYIDDIVVVIAKVFLLFFEFSQK